VTRCRKKRYRTPVDAMLALQRIQRKRNLEDLDKYEVRYYWCPEHRAYHLTSMREGQDEVQTSNGSCQS
jgi:hypothetical protein